MFLQLSNKCLYSGFIKVLFFLAALDRLHNNVNTLVENHLYLYSAKSSRLCLVVSNWSSSLKFYCSLENSSKSTYTAAFTIHPILLDRFKLVELGQSAFSNKPTFIPLHNLTTVSFLSWVTRSPFLGPLWSWSQQPICDPHFPSASIVDPGSVPWATLCCTSSCYPTKNSTVCKVDI